MSEVTNTDLDNLNKLKEDIRVNTPFNIQEGTEDYKNITEMLNSSITEHQGNKFEFNFEYPSLDELIEARSRMVQFLTEFIKNNTVYTFESKILSNDVNKLTFIITKNEIAEKSN